MRVDSDYEPEQPIEAEPVALDYAPSRDRGVLLPRIALITAIGVCALGTIFIFFNVETVLFTGPALLALGIYLVVSGAMRRNFWVAVAGVMHVGVCALFFGLVQLRGWGPSQAEAPFAAMAIIYLWPALVLALTAFSHLRSPRRWRNEPRH